jgi:hypothetical protein
MEHKTLLAYLGPRLAAQPELLATEALTYLLQESRTVVDSLYHLFPDAVVKVPRVARFRSQARQEEARPDIVGEDDAGRGVFVIEGKFWAGLTHNQPCEYLKDLGKHGPGVLLFLAPQRRQETLWAELLRRCETRMQVKAQGGTSSLRLARLASGQCMALASWQTLLKAALRDLEASGESRLQGDAAQLLGLCEQEDSEAFLPLRSEELAPAIPRRLIHLLRLIGDAVNKAVDDKFASKKDPRTGTTLKKAKHEASPGRYFCLGQVGVSLRLYFEHWAKHADTPLWLVIHGVNWQTDTLGSARQALRDLEGHSHLFVYNTGLCVPIDLPLGVERAAVLESIVKQMKAVADRLGSIR